MLLVDSHCHLNFPGLADRLPEVLQNMQRAEVGLAVVIGVSRPAWPEVLKMTETHPQLYASVGVHPDDEQAEEFSEDELVAEAAHPKVVAIGETGLDYHWCQGDLAWQHERFRVHIRAAQRCDLPVVVHTRESAQDTLRILAESGPVRGVMHCFTENRDIARQALDLGMYLSFSGIVTFKNATEIKEVARFAPLDRILVETDSPYLAPMPYRGKQNEPSYVRHVAEHIAELRQMPLAELAAATTDNFFTLFNKAARP